MKKLFIVVAAVLCVSCSTSSIQLMESVEETVSTNVVVYSPEEEFYLNEFYNFCLEIWGDKIPQNIKNDRIAVIRYCDSVIDSSGDVLLEMDGYEIIEKIIWPNGYNVL